MKAAIHSFIPRVNGIFMVLEAKNPNQSDKSKRELHSIKKNHCIKESRLP
tara:strand:+ start:75 stop:224 length:150 start_codon:yes stop_codon:yes gene_type:complete